MFNLTAFQTFFLVCGALGIAAFSFFYYQAMTLITDAMTHGLMTLDRATGVDPKPQINGLVKEIRTVEHNS